MRNEEMLKRAILLEEKVKLLLVDIKDLREILEEDVLHPKDEEMLINNNATCSEVSIPLAHLFDKSHFFFVDENGISRNREESKIITRAFNRLRIHGCKSLSDLRGNSFNDLLNIRNCGVKCACLICIVCEHYGIKIEHWEEAAIEYEKIVSGINKSLRFRT